MPWSWGWKKASLPLGRLWARSGSFLLIHGAGATHFPVRYKGTDLHPNNSSCWQTILVKKKRTHFFLLEQAGLWPAVLRAGAPGSPALMGSPKLWVLVKPPSGEPGTHKTADLFWMLSDRQLMFIVTKICAFSSLIFYWEASVGFQPIIRHPNKSWESPFLLTSLYSRQGKISMP